MQNKNSNDDSLKELRDIYENGWHVDFITIDVLSDPEIRQGIKEFSDWPTIPQLYVKGEFIGGCDIVKEMYNSSELQELLKSKGIID